MKILSIIRDLTHSHLGGNGDALGENEGGEDGMKMIESVASFDETSAGSHHYQPLRSPRMIDPRFSDIGNLDDVMIDETKTFVESVDNESDEFVAVIHPHEINPFVQSRLDNIGMQPA
jgi:hypothetical protein